MICSQRGIGWAMMPFESVAPLIVAGDLVELVPHARVNIPLFWHSRSQSSGVLHHLSDIVLDVSQKRLQS